MPDIEINVEDYQNVFSANVGVYPLIQVSISHPFNTVSVDVITQNPTVNVDIIGTGPQGPKGDTGDTGATGAAAGFGTPTASVDSNVGTPAVTVTASGPDTAKVFDFAFSNLKGDKGDTGSTGPGVPSGGSTGDFLRKHSGTDYDTEWDEFPSIAKGTHTSGTSLIMGKLDDQTASGNYSVAVGRGNSVSAAGDVALGRQNTITGSYSFAAGYNNTVSGAQAAAVCQSNKATGSASFAEGYNNTSSGTATHAEGHTTTASGNQAHSEGYLTEATGNVSHAEGDGSKASGIASHAEGHMTVANHRSQHVFGEFNATDPSAAPATDKGDYVEIVGNGTADNARSNARTLDWSGNETLAGKLTLGADPTNNMEAATKQYVDARIQTVPEAATSAPADLGTAAVGTSAKYALEDHVHNKPTYSKGDVGLGNVDNVQQYSASNPPPYPVTSVNGSTGDVVISVSDTKVEQTYTTTSSYTYWRPVVVGDSAVSTDSAVFTTSTAAVKTFTNLRFQPSTGTLKATAFKGDLTGSVTGTASGNLTSSSTLNPANLSGVSTGTTQFLREDGTWATPAYPSVPGAYTSTPSVLGTASAGVSNDYSRGDHVHEMPSASDVGALADDTKYAASPSVGGPATVSNGIHYAQVDNTSTSTKFTATIPGITSYYDGLTIMLKNGVVTSASGFTININNLGAKQAYNNMAAATAETTLFNVNYTMLFVYDSTRVAGGGWICYRGYNSDNNTIGYQLRTNSTILKTYDKFRYYKILFTAADGTHWVPAASDTTNSATSAKTVNQRAIDPFGRIVYCSATTNYAAEADIAAGTTWDQYLLTLGYSFNRTGAALNLTLKAPVYVKAAPQSDGSAIIDDTTPIVQALPSSDDGKIYIFMGVATSATQIELYPIHPVYCYKGGHVRQWTNAAPQTPAELGAIALPSTPSVGDFLVYTNNGWDAVTMAEWQGGAY